MCLSEKLLLELCGATYRYVYCLFEYYSQYSVYSCLLQFTASLFTPKKMLVLYGVLLYDHYKNAHMYGSVRLQHLMFI